MIGRFFVSNGNVSEWKFAVERIARKPKMETNRTQTNRTQCRLMRALRREPLERPPIWMMRQAGRYMDEYRQVRERTPFLTLCKTPELASDVMVSAVRRIGVDAAILFADLLPILIPMGFQLEYAAGEGPVLTPPIRNASHVDRVRALDAESIHTLDFTFDAVRLTRQKLDRIERTNENDEREGIPLIGFAGAPFTLASYAIEGGASRNFAATKEFMRSDPGAWRELLRRIAQSVTHYLNAQIDAGADVVQIFDSWIGTLGPAEFQRYAFPYLREILNQLRPGTPVIYFAAGNPELLSVVRELRDETADRDTPFCIGVDWRVELSEAARRIGPEIAIQGNLDPTVLLAPRSVVHAETQRLLETMRERPGWIFNLGHGILPQTSVDAVCTCVTTVKEWRHTKPI